MKKKMIPAIVVAIAVLFGTAAYAAWQGTGKQVDANALRQFQKETLPMRDELMAKNLELRNEYAKEKPDQAKITQLRSEITGLRDKVAAAAQKNGLPGYGAGYGRGGYGPGQGMRGQGRGCGRGGYGSGYGSGMMGQGYGNCPMW